MKIIFVVVLIVNSFAYETYKDENGEEHDSLECYECYGPPCNSWPLSATPKKKIPPTEHYPLRACLTLIPANKTHRDYGKVQQRKNIGWQPDEVNDIGDFKGNYCTMNIPREDYTRGDYEFCYCITMRCNGKMPDCKERALPDFKC